MKNAARVLYLRVKLSKLIEKCNKLQDELEEYKKNTKFLENELDMYKKTHRKRYIQQEERMFYLMKREKKLETIEKMVEQKIDFRKVRKVINDEPIDTNRGKSTNNSRKSNKTN